MRNRAMTIILSCLCGLILASAVFSTILLNYTEDRENVVEIELDKNNQSETVEFRSLTLHPGETVEYSLMLTNEFEGPCTLTFDLREVLTDNRLNELKHYVNTALTVNGEAVCDARLDEAFEMDIPNVACELTADAPLEIKIAFHMPTETGNEAQGTDAWFDLILTASNE